jgi:signal peptidase I
VAGCGGDGDDETVDERTDGARRQLFKVPTEQMEPTLRFGQLVHVDPDPDRVGVGDIVVFRPPSNATSNACAAEQTPTRACSRSAATTEPVQFIKRVVAVGGDRLVIEGGRARVNGRIEPERYIPADATCELCNLPTPITVPRGGLYVLGDLRDRNSDSRNWGPIRREWVTGRVVEGE